MKLLTIITLCSMAGWFWLGSWVIEQEELDTPSHRDYDGQDQ
jgi:hypothetical protein